MKSDMNGEPFQKFYNKLWMIIKEFWISEDTEEYWDDLAKALNDVCKEYGNTDAIRRMSLAFCEGRETVFKLKDNKTLNGHVLVSVDTLKRRETDGVNVITLNGEKYIKISSL